MKTIKFYTEWGSYAGWLRLTSCNIHNSVVGWLRSDNTCVIDKTSYPSLSAFNKDKSKILRTIKEEN